MIIYPPQIKAGVRRLIHMGDTGIARPSQQEVYDRMLRECTSWHPRPGPLLIQGDATWCPGQDSDTEKRVVKSQERAQLLAIDGCSLILEDWQRLITKRTRKTIIEMIYQPNCLHKGKKSNAHDYKNNKISMESQADEIQLRGDNSIDHARNVRTPENTTT
jgi:hypothetical protein